MEVTHSPIRRRLRCMPEVQLKGLDKIEVTVPEVEINDLTVTKCLIILRKQKAEWETVERARATEGDRVIVLISKANLKGEELVRGWPRYRGTCRAWRGPNAAGFREGTI